MSVDTQALLQRGQVALDRGRWAESAQCFGLALQRQADNAPAWHNLGLSLFALGRTQAAVDACKRALNLNRDLLPTYVVLGKATKALGDAAQADACFRHVLKLCMNVFGQPLEAVEWVKPLLGDPEFGEDAELTTLMAGLYDRDASAEVHNARLLKFSQTSLQLDPAQFDFLPAGHRVDRSDLPLPNHPEWGSCRPCFVCRRFIF